MDKQQKLFFLPLSILTLTFTSLLGSHVYAGAQGVDIYCVMREGGNDHDSSWAAAYQSLKNERGGIFKISPRQAATIIVQQVVGAPDKYENCIEYLGELYPKDGTLPKIDSKVQRQFKVV